MITTDNIGTSLRLKNLGAKQEWPVATRRYTCVRNLPFVCNFSALLVLILGTVAPPRCRIYIVFLLKECYGKNDVTKFQGILKDSGQTKKSIGRSRIERLYIRGAHGF